jgi:hypothetical protein
MQDTDERAIRGLLAHGVAGEEPPLGSLLGDVVRTGIRVRRRRRALGAVGGTAAAAALAAGIPAATGQLTAAGPAPAAGAAAPGPAGTTIRPGSGIIIYHAVQAPSWFHFVTPQRQARSWAPPLVATTAKSAAQLLLNQTAAGSHIHGVQATLRNLGVEAGVEIDLRNPAGTGAVEMQMSRPGNEQPPECESAELVACHTYTLRSGVKVQEGLSVQGRGPARRGWILGVTVWQPHHGVSASFGSMNYFLSGSAKPQSVAPPVRMKQLLAAALDPRWGWRMSQGFVAQASHLKLGGNSGKVWR